MSRFRVSHTAMLLSLLVLSTPIGAAAESISVRFTVDADGVTRRQSPVAANVATKLPDEPFKNGAAVAKLSAEGSTAPVVAQVEPTDDGLIVRWIEPLLQPNAPKTYTLTIDRSTQPQDGFRFVDGDGHRDLLLGDRPIYRHMNAYDPADRENTYKPFYHLYDFQGDDFITKGAGGKFPHHRGIFLGFKTPHGDFWHCKDGVSLQHRKYDTAREAVGPVASRGVSVTEWVGKDGKSVVRDIQEVTAWNLGEGRLILDFDIIVESLTGHTVPIGGDAHHAGFHFRAAQEVAEVPTTQKTGGGTLFTRPTGANHVKNDVWEHCAWLDGAFDVNGKHFGVTHMDAPTNPRPTTYSSRGYGRFGAYFAADVVPDKPLKLRYRIAVRDTAASGGMLSPEQLEDAYRDFATPVRVSLPQ